MDNIKNSPHKNLINCKWVFRIKRNEQGNILKYKTRLVARGFLQQEGFDYNETYAPVARLTTLRTLLAVSNFKHYHIEQLDVKSAFLHGEIEEEIYMSIPEGFQNAGEVCRLNKALYGLKQAPFCWNKKFDCFIRTEQFIKSKSDPCLYLKKLSESNIYLLLYVDDIIIVSDNKREINDLKVKLQNKFEMQDMRKLKNFLGINIKFDEKGMYLCQKSYIESILRRFNLSNCKPMKTPMEVGVFEINECTDTENKSSEENWPIRELIGALMYLMLATRPDIAFAVNLCSRFQSKPSQLLWQKLKRILRYLQGTVEYKLFYPNDDNNLLVGYADADWAGDLEGRKSTTGYLFKIVGCVVSWTTRKQSTVALSSTDAEFAALCEAAKEGVWLVSLLEDLSFQKTVFTIFEDNQSCMRLTIKFEHKRLKHVDVKFNYIKDLITDNVLKVMYVDTNNQGADVLTKSLSCNLFSKHVLNINVF